ncbi:MAG: hypothetical protein JNL58_12925 [Planctomyces sp.]|nr:hypothetical protein [Planctomyces sp.]
MKTRVLPFALAHALALCLLPGCGNSVTDDPHSSEPAGTHDHGDDHGDGNAHDHASEGPHHGHLIELGNGTYHAELVHDSSSVTIYILDEAAKNTTPIDATEITVNLRHNGKPEQFKLAAAPKDGEPAGKSSQFTLQNSELANHLDDESSEARLSVVIDGTPYTGSLSHAHGSHDHGAHDHGSHDQNTPGHDDHGHADHGHDEPSH